MTLREVCTASPLEIQDPSPDRGPLGTFAQILTRCWQFLTDSSTHPAPTLPGRVAASTQALDELVDDHADRLLAYLLLDPDLPYAQAHPLLVSILCSIVLRRRGSAAGARQRLMQAALTCNIGMLSLHEAAASQAGPLSRAQMQTAYEHPLRSAALLRENGVTDPEWLETVVQHHERWDGSGYPYGLGRHEISDGARLVALADLYAAMVLPRQYRDGLCAQRALREIFLQRGAAVDASFAADFINELGVFPPGIFVRLANGEVGVVVARGQRRASEPLVRCYCAATGHAYSPTVLRDTAQSKFAIDDVLPRQVLTVDAASFLWCEA